MTIKNTLDDQLWIIANNKEAEFELFCKTNDIESSDPMSLRFFINEELANQKQSRAEFFSTGFFICWADVSGKEYRIFTKNEIDAQITSSRLEKDDQVLWVERYQITKGKMKLVG